MPKRNRASKIATTSTRTSTRRFLRNFQICFLTWKWGMWGFLDVRNTNIAIKKIVSCTPEGLRLDIKQQNSYYVLLRIYASIFQKRYGNEIESFWKILKQHIRAPDCLKNRRVHPKGTIYLLRYLWSLDLKSPLCPISRSNFKIS